MHKQDEKLCDFFNFDFFWFCVDYISCSPALTAALRDLAIQIPQLKKEIQEGLLKNLSLILMGRQLRHPGAPKSPLQPFPMSGLWFLSCTGQGSHHVQNLFFRRFVFVGIFFQNTENVLFLFCLSSFLDKLSWHSRCHKHYTGPEDSWEFWLWR